NSEYPAKISRKEFIIDIDCYSNFIETNGIIATLDIFNTEAKNLFEKSIKRKLREKMGIINDE
ncbi:MAG: TIGR04255 family protein, partial [Bacteroidales bacterium]|nr:TIGR04255 family protein [Bacteroidales bacterium]